MARTYLRGTARLAVAMMGLMLGVAGCESTPADTKFNYKPNYVTDIAMTTYDGVSDDLLTAGLGKNGICGELTPSPMVADPANPTAAELRRLAIFNNYRAVVDAAPNGGCGVLYGPNIDKNGNDGQGLIAGTEYLTYADDPGTGAQNITLMVQVPSTFDVNNACIVTGTSSGSRGVYGAMATAGDWGLKHGCAVAYTDKGSGNGFHDLQNGKVTLRDGTVVPAAMAGTKAQYKANMTADELMAFNTATPYRFGYKHAHSQQNPEKDWARDTLRAVGFAFYVLNEKYGPASGTGHTKVLTNDNTIVIASSVSNGAGAAIQAGELDSTGMIDGIAVTEPNVQVPPAASVTITRGSNTYTKTAHSIYDYFTYANLYQPCAMLSSQLANQAGATLLSPAAQAVAVFRCAGLQAAGLLDSTDPAMQADEALSKLHKYGWEADSDPLHATHYLLATTAIAVTYANTYGRFSVKDNLCGFSFAYTDPMTKAPIAPPASEALLFGTGNGIPPVAGLNIVNNNSVGGPKLDSASISPTSMKPDFNLDGAICLRNLLTGTDANAAKVKAGLSEVVRNGNLHGKPTIIVHGRSDALVPVNFTSRVYAGYNKTVEGDKSKLVYIEVANAEHFDTFIDNPLLPGYDSRFVPLQIYYVRAMDAMYAHLKSGAALPTSQVVRTTPRGGTPGMAPALTPANVPPLSASPGNDAIVIAPGSVGIPD